MSNTTRNRHQGRSRLFKRLNTGTHKAARVHQRHEEKLVQAVRICPKCGTIGGLVVERFMKGGTLANGERLDFFRCATCDALVSALTEASHGPNRPARDPGLAVDGG